MVKAEGRNLGMGTCGTNPDRNCTTIAGTQHTNRQTDIVAIILNVCLSLLILSSMAFLFPGTYGFLVGVTAS